MRSSIWFILAFILGATGSCAGSAETDGGSESADAEIVVQKDQKLGSLSRAYFASGCFWCVEEVFESVRGVHEVISGYSGGDEQNPSYGQVSNGETGHAEAVEVYYDPVMVDFAKLVKVFFVSQDPTTPNRQGPDAGTQYRSIAFYLTADEQAIIEREIADLNASGKYASPIVTEVKVFERFWPAEDYHQDYVRQHPNEGYVRGVSIPRFERFKKAMPEVLK